MSPLLLRLVSILVILLPVLAQGEERRLEFPENYCAAQSSLIVASGSIGGNEPVTLVLRIDDSKSSDYATRTNLERTVPPGPFVWRVPVQGLLTSGRQLLDSCAITKIVLFSGKPEDSLTIDQLAIQEGEKRPDNVLAYDLGPDQAAVFPGFDRMTPAHKALQGKKMAGVRRPGPDTLIGDGISGIETIRLSRPAGAWRVTLWTEDPGEWELLPHAYKRQIRANGVYLLEEAMTAQEWLKKRYLAGRSRAYETGQTAWQALGQHRGGMVSATINSQGEDILISLSGDTSSARFVSAVVVEPENGTYLQTVQRQREAEFNEIWRVEPTKPQPATMPEVPVVLAANAGSTFSFALDSADYPAGARVLAKASDPGLAVLLWQVSPRLVRPDGATGLKLSRNTLLSPPPEGALLGNGKADFVGFVSPRQPVRSGDHEILIVVTAPGFKREIRQAVQVLATSLPPVKKPSGFYLDQSPHLAWGGDQANRRNLQLACDLAFLKRLGIDANAPALSTPDAKGLAAFENDAKQMVTAGNQLPALAYAPAKRLHASVEAGDFAQALVSADHMVRVSGKPAIVWSLADEPSNPGTSGKALLESAKVIKALDPSIRLAGHFNHVGDEKFAEFLDTILVNPGFGVDAASLERLGTDREVWLYNMNKPRLAAGLFLHFSQAARYLQWHARMPTADPFDPTDGREGDFQMFLPSEEPCPAQPDIDADLLAMVEGITDQRWLQWLESMNGVESAALVARWREVSLSDWNALAFDASLPIRLRQDITQLARKLKGHP